jgi:hypothetical protein
MNYYQPGDDTLKHWRRNTLVRALAHAQDCTVTEVAQKLFGDEGPEAILKAATLPASTSGWGGATVAQRVGAFLTSLRPRSAAAQLIERGFRVDMAGVGSVSLPRVQTTWPLPAWVAEGEPIPSYRGDFTSAPIGAPKKLAALTAIANELATATAESAEAIISDLMDEAAARALDATMFSNSAATGVAPAGLLNGVTALTATAGGGQNAFAGDVAKLVGAIHAAGGGADVLLFAAPQQAATASILAGSNFALPIIAAPSLAAGTVIAVEPRGFASGFSDVPRVDVGREATLVMEDTSPTQISTAGSPNTVAAPVRSMFQVDAVAIRLVLRVAYGMRAPGLVQFITGATW